jgi:ubiquinone/menaquinone biosynthesis C-methylase UbiE
MTEPYVVHDFGDVDGTAAAGRFVSYLDAVSDLDAVQAYKRRTFALLEPKDGDRLLDLGCGNGTDVLELAVLVGSGGGVVGVDKSSALVDEARERSRDASVPVEFRVGDAHALEFETAYFDGCRSDRTFQHLDDPAGALAELARVTRQGGRVVVSDVDWGTLVIDGSRPFTRTVAQTICDECRQGWVGRQLPRLFHEAGLVDVTTVPQTIILTNFDLADVVFALTATVARLRQTGAATDEEADSWGREMRAAADAGTFFSSLSGFIVRGRVP